MNFDNGKMVGNINENGVCLEFEGSNHCAPDEIPINYQDLECKGDEATLIKCGGNANT